MNMSNIETDLFVTVAIGTPPQKLNLTVATEFDYIWLAGTNLDLWTSTKFDCNTSKTCSTEYESVTKDFRRGNLVGDYAHDYLQFEAIRYRLPIIIGSEWNTAREYYTKSDGIIGMSRNSSLVNKVNTFYLDTDKMELTLGCAFPNSLYHRDLTSNPQQWETAVKHYTIGNDDESFDIKNAVVSLEYPFLALPHKKWV